jgi:large subunit ribosomal protein L6
MSRIGKKIVQLPAGVSFTQKGNDITVKGPKGELKGWIDSDLTCEVTDGQLEVKRPSDQIKHKALHGLYRSLVANMVTGVSEGYKRSLELVGVGYKATNTGNVLDLSVGYSHNILFLIPKEISITTETQKGQNPKIFLEGIDKQLIGQVAAKIRSLRKPEPYKGKGIRYSGEVIRRKAGKSAAKGK